MILVLLLPWGDDYSITENNMFNFTIDPLPRNASSTDECIVYYCPHIILYHSKECRARNMYYRNYQMKLHNGAVR